jgi:hypothetical protein
VSICGKFLEAASGRFANSIMLPFEIEPPIVQGRRTSEVANGR